MIIVILKQHFFVPSSLNVPHRQTRFAVSITLHPSHSSVLRILPSVRLISRLPSVRIVSRLSYPHSPSAVSPVSRRHPFRGAGWPTLHPSRAACSGHPPASRARPRSGTPPWRGGRLKREAPTRSRPAESGSRRHAIVRNLRRKEGVIGDRIIGRQVGR